MVQLNRKTTSIFLMFAALFIYLGTQFSSIYFRNYNHLGPEGLDDADWYISKIAYFKENTLFSQPKSNLTDIDEINPVYANFFGDFSGIISSYFLGVICYIADIRPDKIFYYNFYFGILLSSVVLFLLLKQGDKHRNGLINGKNNFNQLPLCVFCGALFFAFFTGKGTYHGFYWIVPSFYCLMFWGIGIWGIFYIQKWKILTFIIVPLILFSHFSGVFALLLLIFAVIVHGILYSSVILPFLSLMKKTYQKRLMP